MTFQIMLYNPSTGRPIRKFSWVEIVELIGDDVEKLPQALDLFERGDGLMLSKLISAYVHPQPQVCGSIDEEAA